MKLSIEHLFKPMRSLQGDIANYKTLPILRVDKQHIVDWSLLTTAAVWYPLVRGPSILMNLMHKPFFMPAEQGGLRSAIAALITVMLITGYYSAWLLPVTIGTIACFNGHGLSYCERFIDETQQQQELHDCQGLDMEPYL